MIRVQLTICDLLTNWWSVCSLFGSSSTPMFIVKINLSHSSQGTAFQGKTHPERRSEGRARSLPIIVGFTPLRRQRRTERALPHQRLADHGKAVLLTSTAPKTINISSTTLRKVSASIRWRTMPPSRVPK